MTLLAVPGSVRLAVAPRISDMPANQHGPLYVGQAFQQDANASPNLPQRSYRELTKRLRQHWLAARLSLGQRPMVEQAFVPVLYASTTRFNFNRIEVGHEQAFVPVLHASTKLLRLP